VPIAPAPVSQAPGPRATSSVRLQVAAATRGARLAAGAPTRAWLGTELHNPSAPPGRRGDAWRRAEDGHGCAIAAASCPPAGGSATGFPRPGAGACRRGKEAPSVRHRARPIGAACKPVEPARLDASPCCGHRAAPALHLIVQAARAGHWQLAAGAQCGCGTAAGGLAQAWRLSVMATARGTAARRRAGGRRRRRNTARGRPANGKPGQLGQGGTTEGRRDDCFVLLPWGRLSRSR
jgi:hypothetical protein